MLFQFLRKLSQLIPTLIGASVIAFALIRLVPGDPVVHLLGERGGDPIVVQEMKQKFGLDKSLPEQYFIFVSNALRGNMGESTVSKQPVSGEFWARFPATMELSAMALLWSILLGLPLGVIAALKKNSWFDYSIIGSSLVGYSMPIFWWGLICILFFSVNLGWFPVSGRIGIEYEIPTMTGFYLIDSWFSSEPFAAFISSLRHLFLPAFVLGTIPLAVLSRMTRSSVLEVLSEDFIRTTKAKGLSFSKVIIHHALRNALVPIITVVGILVGSLLTGAVLTETIFSWPGIGRWLVKSVEARDYPVIQGGVLYLAVIVISVNLLVDFLYLWAYPRMRSQK